MRCAVRVSTGSTSRTKPKATGEGLDPPSETAESVHCSPCLLRRSNSFPHPSSKDAIDRLAAVLKSRAESMRVEGHTDNVRICNGHFASNWELSTARASDRIKVFVERCALEPRRLSASGCAEFHPVASNTTADGRAQKPPRRHRNSKSHSARYLRGSLRGLTTRGPEFVCVASLALHLQSEDRPWRLGHQLEQFP
jgi:hypothetical protein